MLSVARASTQIKAASASRQATGRSTRMCAWAAIALTGSKSTRVRRLVGFGRYGRVRLRLSRMADKREGMGDKEGRYRRPVVENTGVFVLSLGLIKGKGKGKIVDGVVEAPETISPATGAGARTRRISWRRNLLMKLKSSIGSGTMITASAMVRAKAKATTAVRPPAVCELESARVSIAKQRQRSDRKSVV